MIISRESDYAIRILRVLADGERHSVGNMSISEKIPKQFSYKIVDKLENASYIKCIRGKNGGCELVRDLKTISLLDLLKTIDNDCFVNACLKENHVCEWKALHSEGCHMHYNFIHLQNKIEKLFDNMDLDTLIFH